MARYEQSSGVEQIECSDALLSSKNAPRNLERMSGRSLFWLGITNRDWASLKALYFFLFGGYGAFQPFIVLFFVSRGLTPGQISLIEFLNIAIGTLSRPILGTLADKTARHRLILGASMLLFVIPDAAMVFIPPVALPDAAQTGLYSASFSCNTFGSFQLEVCHSDVSLLSNASTSGGKMALFIAESPRRANCSAIGQSCQLFCQDIATIVNTSRVDNRGALLNLDYESSSNIAKNCSALSMKTLDSYMQSLVCSHKMPLSCSIDCTCFEAFLTNNTQSTLATSKSNAVFYILLSLRAVGAVASGPSISLSDSIVYDILGPQNSGLWGQQRMFGTFGWGIIAGVLGVLIDVLDSFVIMFSTFAVLMVSGALVSLFLVPKTVQNKGKNLDDEVEINFGKAIRSLFLSPLFCITCGVAITSGMLIGVLYVPWPQLMKDLGAPKSLFGCAAAILCSFEIPCLFFAGRIVDCLGEINCFLIMYLAYAIRFTSLAFLTPQYVWLALIPEFLHIFCFALFFSAATRIAALIAKPGTSATVQAILHMSYLGIGMGLGVLISTEIYQEIGGRYAFLTYSAFALFLFALLLIFHLFYFRKALARAKVSNPGEARPKKQILVHENGSELRITAL